MTKRVDPAMHPMQPAGADRVPDCRLRQARIDELLERDDTPLSPRDSGDNRPRTVPLIGRGRS
jgi:hypothetical protein